MLKLGETNNWELLEIENTQDIFFKIRWVNIRYGDGSTKKFSVQQWMNLRKGILTNLFNRELCAIEFVPVNSKKERVTKHEE